MISSITSGNITLAPVVFIVFRHAAACAGIVRDGQLFQDHAGEAFL